MSGRGVASIAGAVAALLALAVALVVWLNLRGDAQVAGRDGSVAAAPGLVEQGAYLARAGNCAGCHTARGGAPFAGGHGIATPFGTVVSRNLTPDPATGLGDWSADDFWRALHNGRSRNGRLLYPACPYPNFTLVTREDADAIFAFLRRQPAVTQPNQAHALRFPYDRQAALAVWRALYFRPGVFEPQAERPADWNRGAYLARGLGHCEACHAARNALGATRGANELGGGPVPLQQWYAPSLASADEAGVATWSRDELVALLQTGTSAQGSVLGPMAQVVFRSTQHLHPADLQAMAVFLQALPPADAPVPAAAPPAPAAMERGAAVYEDRCAGCHGAQGQGAPGAYPPLAGSRRLQWPVPTNIVRVIIAGGFPPATKGHPRPYGMPPFGPSLSNAEIADVATFIRNSWGNRAGAVSELDVVRAR